MISSKALTTLINIFVCFNCCVDFFVCLVSLLLLWFFFFVLGIEIRLLTKGNHYREVLTTSFVDNLYLVMASCMTRCVDDCQSTGA